MYKSPYIPWISKSGYPVPEIAEKRTALECTFVHVHITSLEDWD